MWLARRDKGEKDEAVIVGRQVSGGREGEPGGQDQVAGEDGGDEELVSDTM